MDKWLCRKFHKLHRQPIDVEVHAEYRLLVIYCEKCKKIRLVPLPRYTNHM